MKNHLNLMLKEASKQWNTFLQQDGWNFESFIGGALGPDIPKSEYLEA